MASTSQINNERLKQICKYSLSAFIQKSFSIISPGDEYLHNWHIDCLAEYLTACKNREIKRLCVNVPPRTLKSVSATVAFPAWLLGHSPSERIMTASYARSLSHKHSQDTRFIMQSDWYKKLFPDTIIASDQNEKSKFMTTQRGHRMAVSVGSAATGEGGNILIVDDPTNPMQAASDVERQNANDWFSQTFVSRLDDKQNGVIIVIMQRLHENDVSGMILAQGGYEHLCLPATNDFHRTITMGNFHKEWKVGELLHPGRLSEEVLEATKVSMGTFAYAGQYQQLPSPEGGGIIKEDWWQLWEGKEPPPTHDIIQVYDTAFTEKTSNDYCARTTWGIFEADNGEMNIILLERMNKRLEFPELLQEAKEAYAKYTKRKTGEPPLVLVEEKASGLPLIQELRKTGVRVKGIKRNANSGDKISRCHNITHIFENGRVWVPCNVHEVDGKKHYSPKPFAQEVIDQCMVAGTAIITKYGVKNIEDIKVGDSVLTHKGRFRPVLATFKNTSKDFVKISPKSLDEMVITPNHPLYALSLSSTRKPIELGWVNAGDIQAREYRDALRAGKPILQAYPSACHAATLPIIRRECPIDELDLREWATLPNGKRYDFIHDDEIMTTSHSASQLMKWKQPLDYKFGRIIGLYIAEGSFTRSQTKWSFNALTEQHFVAEVKDFIQNRLGCGTNEYTATGATTISANLPLLESFFLECGKRAENKRIPEWVWDAPDDFVLGLIDGYVDGDGCDNFWNVISCTTVSQSLAWGMRLLGARVGIHATVNVTREARQGLIQGRLCNLQKTYSIRWVKDRQNMGASFLHEDQLAYSVMHSEKIIFDNEIDVYNMRVAEDESYCTTGGMVHNCSLFPNGAHDDLVDTVVDAVAYLRKWREIRTDYDKEDEPEYDNSSGKKKRYY